MHLDQNTHTHSGYCGCVLQRHSDDLPVFKSVCTTLHDEYTCCYIIPYFTCNYVCLHISPQYLCSQACEVAGCINVTAPLCLLFGSKVLILGKMKEK